MSLPGVGAKIADCVCLFSLAKQEAVPLDVHVTRVAKRLFAESRGLQHRSPAKHTPPSAAYSASRFGPYRRLGAAVSVLQ